jgi:hypothetical protein
MQWPRWIAFDRPFVRGIERFMARSPDFRADRFAAAIAGARHGMAVSGTRIMLTASYLGLLEIFGSPL